MIAEGVETEAHGLELIMLGCVVMQVGIERPMPPADLTAGGQEVLRGNSSQSSHKCQPHFFKIRQRL